MLIPNQMIEVCWHPQTREYYISKGYNYTKMRDRFLIRAEDLSPGSHKKVKVECDYCHAIFEKQYYNFLKERENGKDCCRKCQPIKFIESCEEKYGCKNPFQNEEIKQKIEQTCLKKYGTKRACQSKIIKDKIKKTCLDKYGVEATLLLPKCIENLKKSNLEKYGVDNPFKSSSFQEEIRKKNEEKYGPGNIAHTPLISEKIRQTCLEKYGVPYTTMAEEVIKKMRESLYQNGTVPSSKPEKEMCKLLKEIFGEENCFPNYAYDRLNMDCLVKYNKVQIDFEYDGWYWHKDKKEKDKRRNYFLIKEGYKICRFYSEKAIPTRKDIYEALQYLVKENHNLFIKKLDI